jgi:hypothetical protein
MTPQTKELLTILTKAAELGASHCYVAMRRGQGTIFFILNEVIQPIAPCSADVFATLHLAACELGGLDHTIPYGSASFNLAMGSNQLETRIERFMGIEPAICFTFGLNDPIGVLYAEYSLSSPVILALRQLFTNSPRTLYVASSGEGAVHIPETILRTIYFAVDSTYGGNILHVGKAPRPAMPHITPQPELNLDALQADVISQTTITLPLTAIATLPSIIQREPRMLMIRNDSAQSARDGVQLSSLMARDYMPDKWLPLMFLYINQLPRLCHNCRISIQVEDAPYRELQQRVGAKSTTNYAIPETKTASSAYYRYYGSHSILDEIAKDPDMINRSATQATQERKQTVSLWRRGTDQHCRSCGGTGNNGTVLIAGFCDLLKVNKENNTDTAEELLLDRFWTDAFDKLESGLIAYDDFGLIQP